MSESRASHPEPRLNETTEPFDGGVELCRIVLGESLQVQIYDICVCMCMYIYIYID